MITRRNYGYAEDAPKSSAGFHAEELLCPRCAVPFYRDIRLSPLQERAEKAEAELAEARDLVGKMADELMFNLEGDLSEEVYNALEKWKGK